MTIVALWLFWSLISLYLVIVVWRKAHEELTVYALIAISGLHLTGIFMLYGIANHVPIW